MWWEIRTLKFSMDYRQSKKSCCPWKQGFYSDITFAFEASYTQTGILAGAFPPSVTEHLVKTTSRSIENVKHSQNNTSSTVTYNCTHSTQVPLLLTEQLVLAIKRCWLSLVTFSYLQNSRLLTAPTEDLQSTLSQLEGEAGHSKKKEKPLIILQQQPPFSRLTHNQRSNRV